MKWQKCLLERGVLTVLCPAAAESPAYQTLEETENKTETETIHYHASHRADQRKSGISTVETYSWINSSGQPINVIFTITPLAVVVLNLHVFYRENNKANVKNNNNNKHLN